VKRAAVLWIIAFLVTAASAVYQRMTGPTYPMSGKAALEGTDVIYSFERSHAGDGDQDVIVRTGNPAVHGTLQWKRHKTDDPWTSTAMAYRDGNLVGTLPHQPPAGKLDYRVRVEDGCSALIVPAEGGAVIRFKGDVPLFFLIPHVLAMFTGMMFSLRTGLEVFAASPRYDRLIWWTIGILSLGGLVLGPVVQKFAFDALWTGWPFGHDLTDNKTLVAVLAWLIAAIALRRASNAKPWILGAAIAVLIVFMIPHSVLGSELNYREMDAAAAKPQSVLFNRHPPPPPVAPAQTRF
jgi:hypothetical protein